MSELNIMPLGLLYCIDHSASHTDCPVALLMKGSEEAMGEQCIGEMEYGCDADPYWQCLKCGYVERSSPPIGEDDTVWRTHERSNVVDIAIAVRRVIEASKVYVKEKQKVRAKSVPLDDFFLAEGELFTAVDGLLKAEGAGEHENSHTEVQ